DLNTAHILTGAYQDALKFINSSIGKLKVFLLCSSFVLCILTFITIAYQTCLVMSNFQKMQKKQRMSLLVSLVEIEKAAREVLDVLGLLTTLSYAEILKEMKQKTLTRAGLSEEDISQKIEERI